MINVNTSKLFLAVAKALKSGMTNVDIECIESSIRISSSDSSDFSGYSLDFGEIPSTESDNDNEDRISLNDIAPIALTFNDVRIVVSALQHYQDAILSDPDNELQSQKILLSQTQNVLQEFYDFLDIFGISYHYS